MQAHGFSVDRQFGGENFFNGQNSQQEGSNFGKSFRKTFGSVLRSQKPRRRIDTQFKT